MVKKQAKLVWRDAAPTPSANGNACPSCAKATARRPPRRSNSRRQLDDCLLAKIRENASFCFCPPQTLIPYTTSIPCSPIVDDDHCLAQTDGTDPVSPLSRPARTRPLTPCAVSHSLYGPPPKTDSPSGNYRPESRGTSSQCGIPSTHLRIPASAAARQVPPDACAPPPPCALLLRGVSVLLPPTLLSLRQNSLFSRRFQHFLTLGDKYTCRIVHARKAIASYARQPLLLQKQPH
jgi:hypothetical protein